MLRPVLLVVLALAGCAPAAPPPMQSASVARSSDPALMAAFFGDGAQRGVSPVIRCAVRCATP